MALRILPLRKLALGELPLRILPLRELALGELPLRKLALGELPLRILPLRELALAVGLSWIVTLPLGLRRVLPLWIGRLLRVALSRLARYRAGLVPRLLTRCLLTRCLLTGRLLFPWLTGRWEFTARMGLRRWFLPLPLIARPLLIGVVRTVRAGHLAST
ncbi:hypothetical protein BJI47_17875 [Rhodococcus sp. 1168]|nr:hypothetical protein BJI47_17875 [Rhodococcus sp. 1168]